jgi:hypothetical protein
MSWVRKPADGDKFQFTVGLDKQMKTWSSVIYKHFKLPPQITKKGDDIRYVFICKKHVIVFSLFKLWLTWQ